MRKALSITLMLVVALAAVASAKPAEQAGKLEKFMFMDLSKANDAVKTSHPGVFGTAAAGTTWFGGTHWDNVDSRWEANENGVWTFDSGIGSSFAPVSYANPYKNPILHTLMEGWVGVDNTYSEITYFRRLTTSAAWAGTPCVGTPAGLGGNASLWAGALPSDAAALCYAGGQGYGNNWNVCVGKDFTYNGAGSVSWQWDYTNDTELNFDYGVAKVDTSGDGSDPDIEIVRYTGTIPASHANFTLTPGIDMRSTSGTYTLKYCASSDGAYSDEDGFNSTACGAMAVDNVVVAGGGNNTTDDFESGDNGWTLLPPAEGDGGEFSNIVPFNPGAVSDPCGCNLSDSVLVFTDPVSGGHTFLQDNVVASPWIDLVQAGLSGSPGKLFEFHAYLELPLKNYIFVQMSVQWYPAVCQATQAIYTTPLGGTGFVYYFGDVPICRDDVDPVDIDFSTVVDIGAEQLRLALGMLNYCQFYGACTGLSNSTPWFDNVRFGVYGSPDAPYLTSSTVDVPQDAFPASGLLRPDNPGRLDCNNVKGFASPEPKSDLGDTLIVNGGTGNAEVWVEFSVDPGPGINTSALTSWLTNGYITHIGSHPNDSGDWYAARMDTAEQGGTAVTGTWMTAYHEDNPGGRPAASDVARDSTASEVDPLGHFSRLKNDIFPDDLFTPGTRVNIMYRTKFLAGSTWYVNPDTSGGSYYEMEVMPSSMAADSTFNCVLYVDHFDGRGAQQFIEAGLSSFLPAGTENFEGTSWDRWDVRAPSSGQASFGRPLNTEYGATVTQAFGYKSIIWNCGNLSGVNLVKEDAEVLTPWLTLLGVGGNNLYLSGGGVAQSINEEVTGEGTGPLYLLRQVCGVDWTCATVRDAGCGPASVDDTTACLDLNPVTSPTPRAADNLGRTVQHLAQGNGCPSFRSFDLLSPASGALGSPQPDEEYSNGTDTYQYASITNASSTPNYQTVVDGLSVHYRRDPSEACIFQTANYPDEIAVAERLHEVLHFFGYDDGAACSDPTAGVPVPPPINDSKFKTALANFAPNPLMSGAKGTLQFVMAHEGKASVDIFDVNGRLVRTVFNGIAQEGPNTVSWDATDGNSRPVASGVYFYRLRANGEDLAKKLVVVRNGN